MRKVKLAKNAGFCFGVQRAVEEAIKIQKEYMKKVYTLGPLIHNNDVVKYLEEHHIFAIYLKDIDTLKKDDVIGKAVYIINNVEICKNNTTIPI